MTTTSQQPQRTPEVPLSVIELGSNITSLEEAVIALLGRLAPVLCAAGSGSDGDGATAKERYQSSLASSISLESDRVSLLDSHLREAIDLLEI